MKVYTSVTFNFDLEEISSESFEYEGPVALCGSGGGPSGAVEFPDYMEKIHVYWMTGGTQASPSPALTTTVEDVMQTALDAGGNPYTGEAAYAPDTELTAIKSRFTTTDTIVSAIDPEGKFEDFIDKAKLEVDQVTISDTELDAEVAAFEDDVEQRRLREISRFTGGMADINAVNGSQFIIGMALLERDASKEVDRFAADLRIRRKDQRGQLIDSAVREMLQIYNLYITSQMQMAAMRGEIGRAVIVAKKEEEDKNLQIDVLDATWDLTAFQYGANLLAAISGNAHPVIDKPGLFQSVLGVGALGAGIIASFTGNNQQSG